VRHGCVPTAQVSIAAHTLIAQRHGDRAGPHLNGINALFGAGSLLAPAVHRTLSPSLARFSPLASYWVISAAALLVAGTCTARLCAAYSSGAVMVVLTHSLLSFVCTLQCHSSARARHRARRTTHMAATQPRQVRRHQRVFRELAMPF
jgi:hypothetical protein